MRPPRYLVRGNSRQLRKNIYQYKLFTEPWDTAKYWWVEFRRWCWKKYEESKLLYYLLIFPFIAMFFILASGFPGGEGFPNFLQPAVNVTQQGVVANGQDVTLALQNIINNATVANPSNPIRLYFPSGTYLFGQGTGNFGSAATPSQSTGYLTMFGDGAYCTFFKPSIANCKLLNFNMPGEITDITLSGIDPTNTFYATGCGSMVTNLAGKQSLSNCVSWPTFSTVINTGNLNTIPPTGNVFTMGGSGWQGGSANGTTPVTAFPLFGTIAAGSAGWGLATYGTGGGGNGPPTGGSFTITTDAGAHTATVQWNDTTATVQTNIRVLPNASAAVVTGVNFGQIVFPGNPSGGGFMLIAGITGGATLAIQTNSLTGGSTTPVAVAGVQVNLSLNAGCANNNNLNYGTAQIPISQYALRRVVLRDGKPGGAQIWDINDVSQPNGGYNTATGQAIYLTSGSSGTFKLTVQGLTTGTIAVTATAATVQAAIQATGGANAAVVCFGGPLPGTPGLAGILPASIYIPNVPSYSVTVNTQPTGGSCIVYNPMRGEIGLMSDPTTSNIAIYNLYLEDVVLGPNTNSNQEVLHATAQRIFCTNMLVTGLQGRSGMNTYGFDRCHIQNMHCDYFTGVAANNSYVTTLDFALGGASEAKWDGLIVDDTTAATQPNMNIGIPYVNITNFRLAPLGAQQGGTIQFSKGGEANDSVFAFIDLTNSQFGNGIQLQNLPVGRLNCTNCEFGPFNPGGGNVLGCVQFNSQNAPSGPCYFNNCTFNPAGGSLSLLAANTGFLFRGFTNTIYQCTVTGGGVTRNFAGQYLFSGVANSGITTYCVFSNFAGINNLQQTATTPPISGTSYGPFVMNTQINVNVAATTAAATVAIAITPPPLANGTAATTINLPTWTPAVTTVGATLTFEVPAGWTYKLTATNATLSTLTAMAL